MQIRRSVALACCLLALAALPAGADPRTIDPARQARNAPAAARQPLTSTVRGQRVAEPDERCNLEGPAVPDASIALGATRRWIPGLREIVVTLLEANALVMLAVFVVLMRWRATVIPRLFTAVTRLIRRRRPVDRVGRLAERS